MARTFVLSMRRGAFLAIALAASCGRTAVFERPEDGTLDGPVAHDCEAVDFLFVIDDSESMGDNQAKLVANFDNLIGGIESLIPAVEEVHVGVVTTDGYRFNVEGCQDLGSFVVRTGGIDSSWSECGPYAEGDHYMTEKDDLATSFACAARVGTSGLSDERPLQAAVSALTSGSEEPGSCNGGFLRDDALLVLFFVTDEDAVMSPSLAYEQIVDLKGGDDRNVVVASLVHVTGVGCYDVHATEAHLLVGFTGLFEHGFVGAICHEDWTPTAAGVSSVIRRACGEEE